MAAAECSWKPRKWLTCGIAPNLALTSAKGNIISLAVLSYYSEFRCPRYPAFPLRWECGGRFRPQVSSGTASTPDTASILLLKTLFCSASFVKQLHSRNIT
jgi:hypothetical protein